MKYVFTAEDFSFEKEVNQYKQYLSRLSIESVFQYFVLTERKMLSIVDEKEKLYGIITLGDFQKNPENIYKAINRECFRIILTSENKMLLEAIKIYEEHQIESDLPIVDKQGRFIRCLLNNKLIKKERMKQQKKIEQFKEKLSCYNKSYYLKKELFAFTKIFKHTKIYIRNQNIFNDMFSLFEKDLCFDVEELTDKKYLSMIDRAKRHGDFDKDGTTILLDFEICNLHYFPIQVGYDLDTFSKLFFSGVENCEFSRLIEITNNPYYTLKDCILEFKMSSISFSRHHLMTKYISDYLKREGYSFDFDSNSYWGINGIATINNIEGKMGRYSIAFSFVEWIVQQIKLVKYAEKKGIEVYNIRAATSSKMTENEKKWIERNIETIEKLFAFDRDAVKDLYDKENIDQAEKYIRKITHRYPIKRRVENDLLVNADFKSELVNIKNGIRKTCYQPEYYYRTVYFTGVCFALGTYVEDKDTIPSQVAKLIKKNGYLYRVVNLGILVPNKSDTLMEQLNLKSEDIIINLIASGSDKIKKCIKIIETNEAFDNISDRKDMFFGITAHCTKKGNEIYAQFIFEQIKSSLKNYSINMHEKSKNEIYSIFRNNNKDLHLYNYNHYKKQMEIMRKYCLKKAKIGSIVMNANPFTKGHKYLVEYAMEHCDWLHIFVVQEEASFFKFEDRFAMVKNACKNFQNLDVMPSGKMVASNITFPAYFQREVVRDFTKEEINNRIHVIEDLRVFAMYIAPLFNVTLRFIGTEPLDKLTRQYNEEMKEILLTFGIEVIEIPRMQDRQGNTVSASIVRALYKEQKFNEIEALVPDTTYTFLLKHTEKYLKIEKDEQKY